MPEGSTSHAVGMALMPRRRIRLVSQPRPSHQRGSWLHWVERNRSATPRSGSIQTPMRARVGKAFIASATFLTARREAGDCGAKKRMMTGRPLRDWMSKGSPVNVENLS